MKIYLYVIICLLFISSVFALDGGTVNEPTTVWCEIYNQSIPFDAPNANITIIFPNGTTFINNTAMYKNNLGIFKYEFTPIISGNHLMYCNFYNSGNNLLGVASQSVIIKEDEGMMEIAIILGLLGLIAFIIYISRDLLSKPQGELNKGVYSIINPKNISVLMFLMSTWIIVALTGIMANFSVGRSYELILSSLFNVSIWVVAGFNMIYIAIYVIYLISIKLKGFSKV